MNISRKWLREFVDITATDKEYDSVMTLAGQKVETTERMDAEIKNVVVGKVLSMKKHENSDHMWVCMVDCGSGEPVQIVMCTRATLSPWPSTIPGCPAACTSRRASCEAWSPAVCCAPTRSLA